MKCSAVNVDFNGVRIDPLFIAARTAIKQNELFFVVVSACFILFYHARSSALTAVFFS